MLEFGITIANQATNAQKAASVPNMHRYVVIVCCYASIK